jgi:hypothetical protein
MELTESLASDIADYTSLVQVCRGERGDFLLGAALDAAAGVLALRIDDALCRDPEGEGRCGAATRGGYSLGRDSMALAPALSLIKAGAPRCYVALAMDDGRSLRHVDPECGAQFAEMARADLWVLTSVTGEGGCWGEIMHTARVRGQQLLRSLSSMAA